MVEEVDNRQATDETLQLIEKALAHQQAKMFAKFNEILIRFASNSIESLTLPHFDKISPFKVKINLDIPNIEGNIDMESIEI